MFKKGFLGTLSLLITFMLIFALAGCDTAITTTNGDTKPDLQGYVGMGFDNLNVGGKLTASYVLGTGETEASLGNVTWKWYRDNTTLIATVNNASRNCDYIITAADQGHNIKAIFTCSGYNGDKSSDNKAIPGENNFDQTPVEGGTITTSWLDSHDWIIGVPGRRSNYEWPGNGPLVVPSQTGAGKTLTVLPGATITFSNTQNHGGIQVLQKGKLIAIGGPGNARIIFKGRSSGQGTWAGIQILSDSPGTKLAYCDIIGAAGFKNPDNEGGLSINRNSGGSTYVELYKVHIADSGSYGYGIALHERNTNPYRYPYVWSKNVTFDNNAKGDIHFDDYSSATGVTAGAATTLSDHGWTPVSPRLDELDYGEDGGPGATIDEIELSFSGITDEVEKGSAYPYISVILSTGTANAGDLDLDVTVSGQAKSGTYITYDPETWPTGYLYIDLEETASEITVRAESVIDPGKFYEVTFSVIDFTGKIITITGLTGKSGPAGIILLDDIGEGSDFVAYGSGNIISETLVIPLFDNLFGGSSWKDNGEVAIILFIGSFADEDFYIYDNGTGSPVLFDIQGNNTDIGFDKFTKFE